MVGGYQLPFHINPRRGRLVDICPYNSTAPNTVRNAKESSFRVKGGKLFNLLPKELRNIDSENVGIFKSQLDNFLTNIPGQPTIPNRTRAAATNSFIDQIPMTGIQY